MWCSVVLLAFTYFTLFQSANAIKCFMCNSKQEPRCLDPFHGSGLDAVDCTMDSKQKQDTQKAIEGVLTLMTRLGQVPTQDNSEHSAHNSNNDSIAMACQKLEMEVLGERVIGRGCSSKSMGYYRPCDAIKVITTNDIVLHHCSLCDQDECNSSWRLTITSWTLLPLLISWIIL